MPLRDSASPWAAFWNTIFDASRELDRIESERQAETDVRRE